MDNKFSIASRLKLRFETPKGLVSVEDLWDLPLLGRPSAAATTANLDDIAKGLHIKLKDTEVSFVVRDSKSDETSQLKFDIVKYIIDVKLAERDAATLKAAQKEQRQQLLALISQKENEQLAGKSLDDLRKMVEALG